MTLFRMALIPAAVLTSLVAGFLFAFAVVVMPGLKSLADAEFIRAFQAVDGVIQRKQPLFVLVWVGSILALLAATAFGAGQLRGADRLLMIGAACVALAGVQLPTFVVNVPLNDQLQRLDVRALDAAALRRARERFEPRWNRWNTIRTACACLASFALLLLVLRV
jgi:uncharacterized membrane protein